MTNDNTRKVEIGKWLTDDQGMAMIEIWRNDRLNFHSRVMTEILEPNMAEINRRLGQENSASYLAYALEAVCAASLKDDPNEW